MVRNNNLKKSLGGGLSGEVSGRKSVLHDFHASIPCCAVWRDMEKKAQGENMPDGKFSGS